LLQNYNRTKHKEKISLMKKLLLIFILFLISCASTKVVITTLETSDNDTYGYTAGNPILIGLYNDWQKNADLSFNFLSKLSYNKRPLQLILHATVEKPLDQPRKKKSIPLRFGIPTSLGGIFLDLYVVVPKGTTDTLKLYFDEEIKGDLKIPKGFEYDVNQTNNLFK